MRASMNCSGSISPVRNPSLLGTISNSASAVPTSARPSRHLHSSLLHTPTRRSAHSSMTGTSVETGAPILLSLLDIHTLPLSGRRGERRNNCGSGRQTGGTRSDEETSSLVDFEHMTAEAEAAALTMSRAELCDAVLDLRTRIRKLRSTIIREREDVAKLHEGMRETYKAAEREGESITNQLMRRVDKVRRQKAQLEVRLHREEALKSEQAQKLMDLKASSLSLERRLQREEEVTLASMNEQLVRLQSQRQHLDSLLSEHSSLQQMQEFVDRLQTQSTSCGGSFRHSLVHSSADAGTGPCVDSSLVTTPDITGSSAVSSVGTHSQLHRRVDSGDHQEILQYLRHEVSVVEAIQREAYEQGERYIEKRNELERRIMRAEAERESGRRTFGDP
ncbi:uncharacterized protein TEOVI_000787100 [Trypanosoma equiperdum]|uniref:Uncharacterized protein n=2 Tax=Trypanozoon TaxID=39700 RepID=Q581A1_TRYB2|nr:hypothetical protein, conserved [Trypanosoma brucei brucei TREU927]AAX78952.1 hypothetical protein, conserved [Trypanosoma brucei]AAZ13146.1 hypothetical protein, conserved [Trypanosoma brucei brucei TREU927]SCU67130.1 hypothetical protein, conserved [Trypanosoma equiperdum]